MIGARARAFVKLLDEAKLAPACCDNDALDFYLGSKRKTTCAKGASSWVVVGKVSGINLVEFSPL